VTLGEARSSTGRTVALRLAGGAEQFGVITSVNDRFAFVVYWGEDPQATDPADLTLFGGAAAAAGTENGQ